MNHELSRRLARIVVEEMSEVARTRELCMWLDENAIGHVERRRIHLSASDRSRVARLLHAHGLDPAALCAMPSTMTRSDAFGMAINEKAGAGPIGRDRSLVRAIPGRMLRLAEDFALPPGTSLDVPNQILETTNRHASILLVENRECFDAMERVFFRHAAFDGDPLILFRGSPGVSAGSTGLIERLRLPVDVFGDVDPAGLAIAGRIPHARSFVHPSLETMTRLVERKPNHARFRDQIIGAAGARDEHPSWLDLPWRFVLRHACALPQEAFLDPS